MVNMLLLLLLGVCVSICNACWCGYRDERRKFCGYPIVFRGEAKSFEYEGEVDLSIRYYLPTVMKIYTIEVNEVFMMPDSLKANSTIYIRTGESNQLCGATFLFNDDMVFFGNLDEGLARTSSCAPNSAWASLSSSDKQFIADIIEHSVSYMERIRTGKEEAICEHL